MRYEEIVHDVAHRTGGEAALAAEAVDATMGALVGCLQTDVRAEFCTLLPGRLRASSGKPTASDTAPDSARALVWRVARVLHRPAEQAQFLAHTVLVAMREREPQLSRALRLEQDVERFATATESGGGGIGPFNHSVPLFGPDITEALRHMPNWSGNEQRLTRRVTDAGHCVDIALARVRQLTTRLGRAVDIVRVDDNIADIHVCSGDVHGVTALDLDLARHVEAALMQPDDASLTR